MIWPSTIDTLGPLGRSRPAWRGVRAGCGADALGTVTFHADLGADAVWFDSTTVPRHRKYAYDALDRLAEATGREHASTFPDGGQRVAQRQRGLGKVHAADGNVTSMSRLPKLAWDGCDRLASVQKTARDPDVVADDEDEDDLRTPDDHAGFYVCDGSGQRVRKARTSSSSGVLRWDERLYVGPFDVCLKYDGSGDTSVEREALHVQDGDRPEAMVEALTWDGGTPETPEAWWRVQLDDQLGTACGEVTAAGLVIGWKGRQPYGTTAVWSLDATGEVSGKHLYYS